MLAAGAGAETAAAQTDDEDGDDALDSTRHVATFEVAENPRSFRISIEDRVEQYLPTGSKYYVEINGSQVGSFETGSESSGYQIIPSGTTGRIRVVAEDGVSLWRQILTDLRSDEPLTYTFTLDDALSSYPRGEEIRITDQPIVMDALRDAGSDKTILKIGDTPIPNLNDGSDEVGNWYLQDDAALIYEVGINAPKSELVTLTINAGLSETIAARYGLGDILLAVNGEASHAGGIPVSRRW